ncbi:hypothetical protein XELAEV_18018689mg [Xenopus laevis]|uniref:Uncharacterized protein n=1 Tax=Xenopus laevis TaxID=8355 RepID=A0A974DDJ8_XENLA|nr:hypothetical protein XELAEV_18018682mg [Xenopus laevis]OCT90074.1 hypothetical protein XELAEV_18018689mg [Xenopus laevis]
MDKYLDNTSTMPPKAIKSTKPKDTKKSTGHTQQEAELDLQHSQTGPQLSSAEDLVQILGPLLDQKLASIKDSISEVLQEVTSHSQRLSEAEDHISSLEDEVGKQYSTDLVNTGYNLWYYI